MFSEHGLVHFNDIEYIMKAEIGTKPSPGVSRYCTVTAIEFGSGFCGDAWHCTVTAIEFGSGFCGDA